MLLDVTALSVLAPAEFHHNVKVYNIKRDYQDPQSCLPGVASLIEDINRDGQFLLRACSEVATGRGSTVVSIATS